MNETEKSGILRLGPAGCAAVIKLVEARALRDIELEVEDHRKATNAAAKMEGKEDAWFKGLRQGRSERKAEDLQSKIDGKKAWLGSWMSAAWEGVSGMMGADVERLKASSLASLSERYLEDGELQTKRFLVFQEAALTPLFGGTSEPALEEREIKEGCELISTHFGFARGEGYALLKETDSFVKDATGSWTKVVDWSLDTTFEALVKADAAAITSGGSVGLFYLEREAPPVESLEKERVMVVTAKLLNYSRFLRAVEGVNAELAAETFVEVAKRFVDYKYITERQIFSGALEDADLTRGLENLKVMKVCFEHMIEDIAR